MTPLLVYTYVPAQHTASFYYRLMMPVHAMHDLGLPLRVMVDSDNTRIGQSSKWEAFCEADVSLMYQPIGLGPLNNVRQVQTFIPSKRDGVWKHPPSIVLESDDNLFHVSPLNPAYQVLGSKDPKGREIPAGDHIGVVENGERVVKWIDGHQCNGRCAPSGVGDCGKGIDLTANREALNCYRKLINITDAFTCSTPAVEAAVLKEATPRRTQVFPNMIRFDDFEQVDLADHPGEIRILWQGGQNHYEDWYPLRKQLGRITKKYPQVHWVICGVLYHWIMEEIPAERYTFKRWWPYQEHKLRMSMMNHDINLAPLSSSPFNDCRSAIKWYESSVLRKPAVTLAQNTAAYKTEMQDGETGLLFNSPDEFETKLSFLIETETERRRMADNAKQWMSENRDIMKRAPERFEFWQMLRDERKIEQPHVTDTEWDEIERQFEAEQAEAAKAAPNKELVGV